MENDKKNKEQIKKMFEFPKKENIENPPSIFIIKFKN